MVITLCLPNLFSKQLNNEERTIDEPSDNFDIKIS